MENKYKWDLTEIFKNEEDWEKAKLETYELLKQLDKYKGKLAESPDKIYECYELCEKIETIFGRVFSYSMLSFHQNMAEPKNIALYKKAEKVSSDIMTAMSFISPELTKIEDAVLQDYIDNNGKLQKYKRNLEDIVEEKKHVLSKEVENVLATYSEVFNGPENIYDIFTDTEFDYPSIQDEDGKEVKITNATYTKYMASQDQRVRKDSFSSMYSLYKKHINSITEMYMTRVKDYTITSKLRKYTSALDRAVLHDDSNRKVYDNLINTTNANLAINHRYMGLKKKLLGKDELHMYDLYVNTFKKEREDIPYEQAMETVLEGLRPLGEEYQALLKQAFENHWIDVYAYENKRGGAYSTEGVYGLHPFVLTNYTGTSRDISTIAHELGHAMHSYYAMKRQTIMDANYTLFMAEIASTTNELILSHYQIEKETDKTKKAALIAEQIEDLRATLIRQTMFAEFEKIVHERTENLESLTSEELCNIYYELNKKYFGDNVVVDEEIKYEWARIPHFYSCFYVYKYATSICFAINIADRIIKKEEGIVEKYIDMLSRGRLGKAVDLLKLVGIDIEQTEPFEAAFRFYEEKIEELEELI